MVQQPGGHLCICCGSRRANPLPLSLFTTSSVFFSVNSLDFTDVSLQLYQHFEGWFSGALQGSGHLLRAETQSSRRRMKMTLIWKTPVKFLENTDVKVFGVCLVSTLTFDSSRCLHSQTATSTCSLRWTQLRWRSTWAVSNCLWMLHHRSTSSGSTWAWLSCWITISLMMWWRWGMLSSLSVKHLPPCVTGCPVCYQLCAAADCPLNAGFLSVGGGWLCGDEEGRPSEHVSWRLPQDACCCQVSCVFFFNKNRWDLVVTAPDWLTDAVIGCRLLSLSLGQSSLSRDSWLRVKHIESLRRSRMEQHKCVNGNEQWWSAQTVQWFCSLDKKCFIIKNVFHK